MPMTEDLSVFFEPTEHATSVTIDAQDADGIFDRAYAEVFGMQTVEPMFTMSEAAATAIGADEDSVLIVPVGQMGAGTYTVRELHPDGTGIVILLLRVA